MKINVAGDTDVGVIRDHNEDSFSIDKDQSLLIMADGMGGHAAGEVASTAAVESINQDVVSKIQEVQEGDEGAYGKILKDAVKSANRMIFQMAEDEPAKKGMGTTVTAMLIKGESYIISHVGDSRAYLIRDGGITQMTKDHSLVQEMIDGGTLSPEDARHHPERNIVTRCVGINTDVEVDIYTGILREGDRVLLCCDGLSGPVEDSDILRAILDSGNPSAVCRQLISMANQNGGHDNVTAILAVMGDEEVDEEDRNEENVDKTAKLSALEDVPETEVEPEIQVVHAEEQSNKRFWIVLIVLVILMLIGVFTFDYFR